MVNLFEYRFARTLPYRNTSSVFYEQRSVGRGRSHAFSSNMQICVDKNPDLQR